MENKLELLLNILIERGWKPFGINHYCYFNIEEKIWIIWWPFWWWEYILEKIISLRDLVSKESWLWQFVCENGMVKNPDKYWKRYKELTISDGIVYMSWEYEYRLIESSLKDESELGNFLLYNIVIKDE